MGRGMKLRLAVALNPGNALYSGALARLGPRDDPDATGDPDATDDQAKA